MAIPTIEQIEESGRNMDSITEEVKSQSDTLVDQYGDTRKTMTGRQNDSDTAISSFNADGAQAISDIQDDADNIVYATGFINVGLFSVPDSVSSNQETLTYAPPGDVGEEWAVTSATYPYTPNTTSPYTDTNGGVWRNVTLEARKQVARSLNVKDVQVIYQDDTNTVLDDVVAVYDKSANQIALSVPDLNGIGETIVTLVGRTLTTTGGVYELVEAGTPSETDLAFLSVDDMIAGRKIGGKAGGVTFSIPMSMSTGGVKWKTAIAGPVDLGDGVFAAPLEFTNVRDFNPPMTNGQDDSQAFADAIAVGRTLYIPRGSYWVTDVEFPTTMLVFGDGPGATLLKPFGTGKMFKVTGGGDYVQFEQLRFFHDRSFDVTGVSYEATASNRWCHMDTVYFEGLKGTAIHATNIILESVFSKLKVSKCGDSLKPAMWFQNPIADGDFTNNITIRDLALYAPQGVGIRFESEKDSSPLPGSRTIRILDSLIHGGTAAGGTTPPFAADLVQFDGITDFEVNSVSFRQIASGHRAVVASSVLATKNRGGLITNCLLGSFEAGWLGFSIDNTQDFTIGVNRTVTSNCVEHIRLGADVIRAYLDRQNTYLGANPIIVDNGSTTRGYVDKQRLALDYDGPVSLSGVRGLNGSVNIAGTESITSGTTAAVTFPTAEVDGDYRIMVSVNAGVNVWWSTKGVNGFTVNIGSAVSCIVNWFVVR